MFFVWELSDSRATRDIDLLGHTPNLPDNLTKIFNDICQTSAEDDGVKFNTDSIVSEIIQEQNTYSGIRTTFTGEVGKARAKMQIDVGFGDIVYPEPVNIAYPTMLSMPAPCIIGYTTETLIAEKTHTMVRHGARNSRIKDFFDIWFLSHQFSFKGSNLANAIETTFSNREMPIEKVESIIFNRDFGSNALKQNQWRAFLEKNTLKVSPSTFNEVMEQIWLFISPIFETKSKGDTFELTWKPPGPWK